jgi:hypothetical protein
MMPQPSTVNFGVALGSGREFRVYISQCPDQHFGWRVYGKVKVTGAGDYTFCTTSSDGSLFYMDLSPSPKISYALLIDNDGVHGPRQYCKAVTLSAGFYDVKVRLPISYTQFNVFVS